MPESFDFTSTPPDEKTPWKNPIKHRGEDAWNGSKEARTHPELCSTGYGTIDIDIGADSDTGSATTTGLSKSSTKNPAPHPDQQNSNSNSKQNETKSESDDLKEHDGFGHTVHTKPSPQNYVHRDLKDI
ncbi:hypothetical protein J3Q64DRAFT_1817036 [Phycomyces blakesleeanus]|uniref:Uncharacterized protein n=2 Tax=Phycomyces blakesleeanus TaxID=4837 RepID=A0A162PZ15_PHYB8|nr:hypothetical protein PHYBLDRAFT_141193 [Phycomyces blakesleeanus NRRL 1555(-)]OAD77307.1 hypothetical protein PHYBLDRAFT_141193 [Phycomyces blakesleeanus NRRL 1555(-)]|eukprot:XP_018295347.1 hypothetical protein PHYBLDRAFT_141193 [Phycomyces blakesleeanus NRRL 1555(-)]